MSRKAWNVEYKSSKKNDSNEQTITEEEITITRRNRRIKDKKEHKPQEIVVTIEKQKRRGRENEERGQS